MSRSWRHGGPRGRLGATATLAASAGDGLEWRVLAQSSGALRKDIPMPYRQLFRRRTQGYKACRSSWWPCSPSQAETTNLMPATPGGVCSLTGSMSFS